MPHEHSKTESGGDGSYAWAHWRQNRRQREYQYRCIGADGSLVLLTDHKNNEYGFVGDNGEADELFFRLCTPEAVIELIAALEAAQKRNAGA
ncbi:hypothetical protein [Cronobacter sakazakii]|uniref:hypothetical protein n=1 Tax=Cronobacter sakazakii TaxID=28141 RepID=UPI000E0E30D6|nr:hypothetical protein [Cronobacter sakazakii]